MILLLLAVWGGVGVWWFMQRPEGSRTTDSIGSFRQQLRVLERTGPTTVAPAYRMATEDLGVFGASRTPALYRPVVNTSARRRRAQKRRRDIFYGLLCAIGGSIVLGFLPGLSVMWWLAVLLIAGLGVYSFVLFQMRAEATARADRRVERAAKVRYLRPPQVHQPEAAYLLRRSATN